MENVGLTSLSEDVFRSCWTLKKLSLYKNLLTTLPKDIFKDLYELEELNLGFNRLRCLNKDWFRNLVDLEVFRACCNPIKQFSADLLANSTHLEELTLHDNLLGDLNAEKIVENYQELHKIEYNGNDFPCLRAVEINAVFRENHISVSNFTDPTAKDRYVPILDAEGIECLSDWAWAPNNYVKSFMPSYPNLCHLRSEL